MGNLKIGFKIGSAERKFAMLCEDEGEKIKCNAYNVMYEQFKAKDFMYFSIIIS